MVDAIRSRLRRDGHRFRHVCGTVPTVHNGDLAVVVAEIVAEYTDHLIAERDALAEDLAWELNATRTATSSATDNAGTSGGGA
jgi:hypothetical protein